MIDTIGAIFVKKITVLCILYRWVKISTDGGKWDGVQVMTNLYLFHWRNETKIVFT